MWSHIGGCGEGRIVKHTLVQVCGETMFILDTKPLSWTHACLGHCNALSNGQSWPVDFCAHFSTHLDQGVLDYPPLSTTHHVGPYEEEKGGKSTILGTPSVQKRLLHD